MSRGDDCSLGTVHGRAFLMCASLPEEACLLSLDLDRFTPHKPDLFQVLS